MPEFTNEAADRAKPERSNLLEAIRRLETAVCAPAPLRELEWVNTVRADVERVCSALELHRETVQKPGGLYEQIEKEAPQFSRRLDYMRTTNRQLIARGELLLDDVRRGSDGEAIAFMAIREQAINLMSGIRHQQAREVDLVYEAFTQDIGSPD